MADAAQIMTPVSADHVLRQAEIDALRQLSDSVGDLRSSFRDFAKDLKEVREKVISMEAAKFETQLAAAVIEAKDRYEEHKVDTRRELNGIRLVVEGLENRVRVVENANARFGLVLAILGTIGGAAVGALVVKVFSGI